MGQTQITFTPKVGSGSRTLNLGAHPVVSKFEGFVNGDVAQTISVGGKAITIINDVWHEFELELPAFGPVDDRTLFQDLTAWWSHAVAGGLFSFALDADKDASSTLSGAEAAGQTVLSVTDTTGFAADDWVFLEDADDATVFQRAQIQTVDSGVQVTLYDALDLDFVSGSVFRHAEYLPSCLALEDRTPFVEREAGDGPNRWDLKLRLRTVRN